MKKLILLLSLLLLITLSACDNTVEEDPIDLFEYSDFTDISIPTNGEAETKSTDKYIVYYYQEACTHCQTIKQEILGFADTFTDIDFYILDAANAPDYSSLEEFEGTPTVFVFSGEEILESYIGITQVREFIQIYSNLELTYDTFDLNHLTSYQEVLDIESDTYYLYYYLDSCPNCIAIKDNVLSWAFTLNINNIFFMNGSNVVDPDNIPTELQILASGSPLLIVMNNGIFTDEYYSDKEAILSYIESDTE